MIIEKSVKNLFGFFPNGISKEEINTSLFVLRNELRLNDVATNKRGVILNEFVDDGIYNVIGGKEISRYGVKKIRGKINSDLTNTNAEIKSNSVLVQGIVAHILNPYEHIKIIACIGDNIDAFIADNINQIVVENGISNRIIWGILNSTLINWFAYLFIYGKSIRTMRFDNPVTSRIPIPKITLENKALFENVADYIIFLKSQSLDDITENLMPVYFEQILNGMVYELYLGEQIRKHDREVIKYLGEIPRLQTEKDAPSKMNVIRKVFEL